MSGRVPSEPSYPSPHGRRYDRRWLGGWLLAGACGAVVLAVSWFGGAGTATLALIGAATAITVAVALHHVVITQDAGELRRERPDTSATDLPSFLSRRHVVGGGIGIVIAGLAALFGLRRFGRIPPSATAWRDGAPLRTIGGAALRPQDVPVGGVVTVWPEGAVGAEREAVMLIRLREPPEPPTRMDWVVDETLVAYTRLCTHAGCAVALYRDVDQALFCPCHQATFDARHAATPVTGPASIPLPQLPLALGQDGRLIAAGDLSAPPGPASGRATT